MWRVGSRVRRESSWVSESTPSERDAGRLAPLSLRLFPSSHSSLWCATRDLVGGVGRSIVAGDQASLKRLLLTFCGVALPAAVVNAILKYLQRNIKLSFMRRLTLHLHDLYCSNRAYYAASWLGGLTSADQVCCGCWLVGEAPSVSLSLEARRLDNDSG